MTLPISHPTQLHTKRPELLPLTEEIISHDHHNLRTYEWHPGSPHDPRRGFAQQRYRPRALIVLAHGYGEHANRHRLPIADLVRAGFLVAALDHRGHGRSEGPRATCARFDDFTDDFTKLVNRTRARYPHAPLYTLGYSMGSLIALRHALLNEDAQDTLAGLILAGVALHPIPRIPGPARPVLKTIVRHVSRFAPHLPVTPPCEDRCRPGADDLCYSGPTTARFASQLLDAGDDTAQRLANLRRPLLILHGARDRVTGSQGAVSLHDRAASPDKTLRLFDDLHHPVLTPQSAHVARATLLHWLDQRVPETKPASSTHAKLSQPITTERIAA